MKEKPLISLLLPTRERLERATCFLQSIIDTASELSTIEVIIAIDDDDIISTEIQSPHPDLKIIKTIAPRTTMGGLNTRCLQHASGSIIMLVNDDIQIRSKGWDQILIRADQTFADKIYLMHTKDGFKDEAFPIFPIISKKCAEVLKDPYPNPYCGDGNDTHLHDIFLRLKDKGEDRFIYLDAVFFEHLHHALGKSDLDKTYANRSNTAGSRTFYSLWKHRENATQKLLQSIQGKAVLQTESSTSLASPFSALLACFLSPKQSLKYRLHYLCYHSLRELYFILRLNHLKAKLKSSPYACRE